MHWLIDGNNLLHLIPEILWTTPGQGQALALACLIKPYRSAKKLKITLFFDGGENQASASLSGMPCVFSGPEKSADQVMLEFMQKQPANALVLVSNDSALCAAAESMGARCVSAGVFADRLRHSQGMEDEAGEGWNFSTRKKGPSRRLPKNKRQQNKLLNKL